MKRAIAIWGVVMAGTCFGAPTIEEILSTAPNELRRPYRNGAEITPDHNLTPWAFSIAGVGAQVSVTHSATVRIFPDNDGNSPLISEAYFTQKDGGYTPTPKFIDETEPSGLDGGIWTFSYSNRVATWQWNQEELVASGSSASSIAQANLNMSENIGRAISRAVRGKNPRKAIPLVARQLKLLQAAQAGLN